MLSLSPQWLSVILTGIGVLVALVGLGLDIYWRSRAKVPPQRDVQGVEVSQLPHGREQEQEM